MDAPSADRLSNAALFDGMTLEARELMANLGQEVEYDRGATVFEHDSVGDFLYVILEGRIRISRELSGLGEEVLAVLDRGAVFGEMAMLDGSPRSATARADQPCRLLAFDKTALEDLMLMRQDVALEVLWNLVRILSGRLRDTNDKLAMLGAAAKF
jgi:CRP/FNR family cyclic AMP-dependent transcriptional regulator